MKPLRTLGENMYKEKNNKQENKYAYAYIFTHKNEATIQWSIHGTVSKW